MLQNTNGLITPQSVEAVMPAVVPVFDAGAVLADGRFMVLEHIYASSQTDVYRAADQEAGDQVAVKILHENSEESRRRARRELETHQILDGQPGIVATRSLGSLALDSEGQTAQYVATEFAQGGTLARVARETGRDLEVILGMASGIMTGLELMHEQGMVHRDVKPGNILADESGKEWSLTDFGIVEAIAPAKAVGSAKRLKPIDSWATSVITSRVFGTPGYIAPESLGDDQAVGPEADIFAMGVTLFNAATGQLPFSSGRFEDYVQSVTNESPVSVRDLRASVPASFDRLTLECLSRDPGDRPTAEELMSDLQTV